MKCPFCEQPLKQTDTICPACKQPLPAMSSSVLDRWYVRLALFIVGAAIALFVLGFGAYKLYYWAEDYQIARVYGRGARAPVVSAITLADGRAAHAINFFADDGGQVYIPELNRSTVVSGRVARVEIADSEWFSGDMKDVESAIVRLSPVLIAEDGGRTQLPTLTMTVEPPQSPVQVLSPKADKTNVFTSVYPLQVQVVPGSTVLINGEDETDIVDRSGLLSANVNIFPVGDNVITILVRTPNHLETRRDVTIYRAKLDIEIEIDTAVKVESDTRNMPVSGTCEPGAMIEVDSPHLAESVFVDMSTGRFSFLTAFDRIGENVVRFHAAMEGRSDAEVHFTVKYRPTYPNYTRAAWPIRDNYSQLRRLYEQWNQRVFECTGSVIDVFTEGELQYIVMDTGPAGEQQLVVLINESATTSPLIGSKYVAYAHVEGRYMYKSKYEPLLTTLYMDVAKAE